MKALNELYRCCGNLNSTAKQKKTGSYPPLACNRAADIDIFSIFDKCVAEDEEENIQDTFAIHVSAKCVEQNQTVLVQ